MFSAVPEPSRRGSLALIRSYLPNMRPSYKRIADFILNHPETTLNLSIGQVARRADVSPSTVSRFCASLGFDGFPSFKSALRLDLLSTDQRFYEDLKMDDPTPEVVRKVFELGVEGLRDTLVTLDAEAVHKAAEAILDARHVCFAPCGMSSSGIARILSQKLLNLGILSLDFSSSDMANRYIATLSPDDVVIAISHSGTVKGQIGFLEQSKEQGATTICITNYMEAPLVAVSDIALVTAAGREAPLRGEPIAVRLSQVALIDTLYAVLSLLQYRREHGTVEESENRPR